MTLELTTNVGVGGFPFLTRRQQIDALAWLGALNDDSAATAPKQPKQPKTPRERKATHDAIREAHRQWKAEHGGEG